MMYAIVQGEHVVFIEDVTKTEGYRTSPHFRELVDRGGYRLSLIHI